MLAPCDALLIRGPMQCDSGELLILGYEIPENPLPGNALLIEMPKCDSGELLILGHEVTERQLCDSSCPATRS